MNTLNIWGFKVAPALLSQTEHDYLASLPNELPTVEWVWAEMNRVWQLQGLDNKSRLAEQSIGNYYGHPVWLMNGIFTALDPVSATHRSAIAAYLKDTQFKSIADYGGGFGELALAIAKTIPSAEISIIEPYPSKVGLQRLEAAKQISVVPDFNDGGYEALIAQDVLEHVEDPIGLAFQIANATRKGGRVIFANCFCPVIQCHLPATFHLRHTFVWVMKALGLRYLGSVPGASHALVFERVGELTLAKARRVEFGSRLLGPVFNRVRAVLGRIKRMVFKP
ncbi:MAG: methyltransferase domain-containing protein [Halothiobacillus sp.]|jgi:2-polyprenyl-3-methyl-5-hydroxy-6-metoxy-1,4-benzoquinol methylase|nr:methyltransferase domain-containing protein [Halothiobacillus sp.]